MTVPLQAAAASIGWACTEYNNLNADVEQYFRQCGGDELLKLEGHTTAFWVPDTDITLAPGASIGKFKAHPFLDQVATILTNIQPILEECTNLVTEIDKRVKKYGELFDDDMCALSGRHGPGAFISRSWRL